MEGSDALLRWNFLSIRSNIRLFFRQCEVSQWKFEDYLDHCKAMPLPNDTRARKTDCDNIPHTFFARNYGYVLGERTIWCQDWMNGKEEISLWPCTGEMRWEGEQRAQTGTGRFLPLPREPNVFNWPWYQLKAIEQYPLDRVCRVPTMEDVYLPVDEIDDSLKYRFIDKELEEAIEASV